MRAFELGIDGNASPSRSATTAPARRPASLPTMGHRSRRSEDARRTRLAPTAAATSRRRAGTATPARRRRTRHDRRAITRTAGDRSTRRRRLEARVGSDCSPDRRVDIVMDADRQAGAPRANRARPRSDRRSDDLDLAPTRADGYDLTDWLVERVTEQTPRRTTHYSQTTANRKEDTMRRTSEQPEGLLEIDDRSSDPAHADAGTPPRRISRSARARWIDSCKRGSSRLPDRRSPPLSNRRRRFVHQEQDGVAMRQPVKCPRTGLWLARYTAPDGSVLQVGRFERKRDAQKAIAEAMGRGRLAELLRSVVDFFEDWLERFPGTREHSRPTRSGSGATSFRTCLTRPRPDHRAAESLASARPGPAAQARACQGDDRRRVLELLSDAA